MQYSSSRGCTQRPLERELASTSKEKRAQELFALEVSLNFSAMMYMIKHGEAQSDYRACTTLCALEAAAGSPPGTLEVVGFGAGDSARYDPSCRSPLAKSDTQASSNHSLAPKTVDLRVTGRLGRWPGLGWLGSIGNMRISTTRNGCQ